MRAVAHAASRSCAEGNALLTWCLLDVVLACTCLAGRCTASDADTNIGPLESCTLPVAAGKIVFGVSDTLQCLEMGAVETLIVWENLEARPGSLREHRLHSIACMPRVVCSVTCNAVRHVLPDASDRMRWEPPATSQACCASPRRARAAEPVHADEFGDRRGRG